MVEVVPLIFIKGFLYDKRQEKVDLEPFDEGKRTTIGQNSRLRTMVECSVLRLVVIFVLAGNNAD
jgi:hypothetical protein